MRIPAFGKKQAKNEKIFGKIVVMSLTPIALRLKSLLISYLKQTFYEKGAVQT